MKRAFAILDAYEKKIDLGRGRAKFIDWVEKNEATFTPAQMDFLVDALLREASSADNPAAFTMWAVKGPIGAWMNDGTYDRLKSIGRSVKRRSGAALGGGPEPVQRILRGSNPGSFGLVR